VVYGGWPYPDYPPYYWPPPAGYYAGGAIATGLAFSAGFAVGAWATNDRWWGGGFGWGGNDIHINREVNINNINVDNNWRHNAEHRHGVRYNNKDVANRYDRNPNRNNVNDRADFRGRDDANRADRPGGGEGAAIVDAMTDLAQADSRMGRARGQPGQAGGSRQADERRG
jgi:hypothetical protein